MASSAYDLVVVGAGPGGYVAAIKAAQLGLKTACVDARGRFGGTCLNVGCIPSKALLHSSHLFAEARHGLEAHGVRLGKVELDLPAMQANKAAAVKGLTDGIAYLFKKNGVTGIHGRARLAAPDRVAVTLPDGSSHELEAKHVILAPGSEASPLPGVTIDEERIVSSTGALELKRVPGHLLVIGGGYIGLELGVVWRRLGAEVTVVEFLDRLTPGMDGEIARHLQRILARQGLKFRLGTKVVGVTETDGQLSVGLEPAAGGPVEQVSADTILVAIGRRPFTDGLGLAEAGVQVDAKGRIQTDAHWRTNLPNVYAIGDAITGPMLAHKAEEEGVAVAELLAGQHPHIDYDVIPGVIYTAPEVAAIGRTEEQLKADGIAYKAGKFPFQANSRARATGQTDGFVKILADATTDRILGAHIIGAEAGTLIAEVSVAMEFGASSEDLARTCHAHPTLEEAVKEAAMATYGSPIHI